MTREEAIEIIRNIDKAYRTFTKTEIQALEMAIKALEQEPQTFKWCTDCKEYDQEKHCCHRWSKVIRDTVEEMKQEQEPMVEIDLDYVIKQKYIEREVLEKIRAEISTVYESLDGYDPDSLGAFVSKIDEILDKYKAETEEEDGQNTN